MIFASPGGKSEKGGTSRKKLLESRIIATLFSLRTSRSIAAFMKCVVPTVTLAMSGVESLERVRTARTASSMPWVTSGEVGVLKCARRPRFGVCCWALSMATASVFVPGEVVLVRGKGSFVSAADDAVAEHTSYIDTDADASSAGCWRSHDVLERILDWSVFEPKGYGL
jgi:hypothetical protein